MTRSDLSAQTCQPCIARPACALQRQKEFGIAPETPASLIAERNGDTKPRDLAAIALRIMKLLGTQVLYERLAARLLAP